MKRLSLFFFPVLFAAMIISCVKVEVNPAVACTDVVTTFCIKDIKVGDESVDDNGSTVEVSTVSDNVVKWDYVDGDGSSSSESETVSGFNAHDGDVWTVYASYVDY